MTEKIGLKIFNKDMLKNAILYFMHMKKKNIINIIRKIIHFPYKND
jgi:hypothetical protein